ncbi:MAG: S8 family peptidase [Microbacteriaceae bacterium]
MSRIVTRSSAVGLAALLLMSGAASASAAPQARAAASDGLWYFSALHVADAHAAGFTGKGVTIAVIDSPINADVPTLQGADIQYYEKPLCFLDDDGIKPVPTTSKELSGVLNAQHGTNVVSYLVGSGKGYAGQTGVKGVAPEATVLAYALPQSDEPDRLGTYACKRPDVDRRDGPSRSVAEAMNDAMDKGADIISFSLGLPSDTATDLAFSRAIREGVVVVAALDNSTEIAISNTFPGTGNGAVSVQAIDSDINIATTNGFPNRDSATDIVAPGVGILLQGSSDGTWKDQRVGRGTSFATPIVAGFLAVVKQKYPDATGNQLIQSLIHNTGRDDGTATLDDTDEVGYGTASLTVMLTSDPSQYPDENPLINDLQLPDRDFLFDDSSAEATTTPTPPAAPGAVGGLILTVGIVIAGLILIAIIVLVVVLATRRSRRSTRTDSRS